jgi:glycosyltransferase involved in cell wall biosynthesis
MRKMSLSKRLKVSVIVPVYNSEKFINACVDSLLGQTYSEIEVVVVDDGSVDSTPQKLSDYIEDHRVRIVKQENRGVSAARNTGLAFASGEFVAFVDSDDVVHPELFATCVNLCTNKGCDFVLYDHEEFSSEQIPRFAQISSGRMEFVDEPLSYYLDNGFKGGVWAMFVRRELLEGLAFLPGVSKGEDMCFSFSLLPRLKKGRHIRLPLYFYRRTEGSLDSGSLSLKDMYGFAEILRNLNRLYSSLGGRFHDIIRRRWFPKVIKNIVKRGVRLASTDDAAEMECLIASLIDDGIVGYVGFTWRWRWYLWRMRRKCKMRRRT